MNPKLVNDKGEIIDPYSPEGLKALTRLWTNVFVHNRLMYEPTWLGIPIIQFPCDLLMMQELIWKIRPDVIVETGIAHGGSAILYASILELLGKGRVIGIDVEIRKYNRLAINSHPLSHRIELIEGSSIDAGIVGEVRKRIHKDEKVLVTFDSNHSFSHVLSEMELYAPLVSADSYMVVMDGTLGLLQDLPNSKPEWSEDNPLRAIHAFLERYQDWEIDPYYNRMLITSNPDAFLRRRKQSVSAESRLSAKPAARRTGKK